MTDYIDGHPIRCHTCGARGWSDDGYPCDCLEKEEQAKCQHKDKDVDFSFKWREQTYFRDNGDISVPVECTECGAEGRQVFKPSEIEWEE